MAQDGSADSARERCQQPLGLYTWKPSFPKEAVYESMMSAAGEWNETDDE